MIAVGNPYGLSNTVSTGIISALNRNIAESDYDDFIQTDAAINHGNSGGPLFNMRGEVIGINSVIFAPAGSGGSIGLAFAMPSNNLQFVTRRLRRFGYVRHGFLGVAFQDLPPRLARTMTADVGTKGVIIPHVAPGTPAAAAGLRVGDIVQRFASWPVDDSRALARAIAEAPIGQDVDAAIWRSGAKQQLAVRLIEAPHPGSGRPTAPALVTAAASDGFGLTLAPLTDAARHADTAAAGQSGVLVAEVTARQAAAAAGLEANDIIVMAQRHSVSDPGTLLRILHAALATGGVFASLLVLRHGQFHWVALALRATP